MKTCFSSKYPIDCLRLSDNLISVESTNFRFKTDLIKLGFKNTGNYFHLQLNEFLNNSINIKDILKIEEEQFNDFVTKSYYFLYQEKHSLLDQVLINMKLPLLPYQIENVSQALHNPYFLIGDSMGLGKTPSALAIASICKKTIVISPAFLKINWQREAKKFTNLSVSPILTVRELTKQKDNLNFDVLLVNYEIIDKIEFLFEDVELIICDEFHKIANPQSKMSKALFKILMKYKPKRFLGLSGTAINNKVGEFFNPLRLLSLSKEDCGLRLQEDKRYNVQFRFNQFFSYEKHNGYGSQFFGLRNYSELKKLLIKKYIRHTIEENLPEMPSIRRIEIDAGEYELELANKLQECFERQLVDNKENENKYLSTIKREAAESKITITGKLLEQLLETEEKVIVFSDHRTPVLELSRILLQYEPVVIIGGMDLKKRQESVDKFQLGKSRILIATIGSASTGLTLTASHICVFNDLPWVPAQLLQAEGRIRRIGQQTNCISYIISKSNIDKIILSTLINKSKILNAVLSEGKENLFKIENSDTV